MTDALERFQREYQQYNGISPQRASQQQKLLRAFEDHGGKPLLECGGAEFGSFMAKLVEDGLHVNTVRKNGNMIRPFYAWAYGAGLYSGEDFMSIKAVKNPRGSSPQSEPNPYSAKELARFRRELEERLPLLPDYRVGYYTSGRAKFARVAKHAQRLQIEAIVGLALYGGLRRAEIFALTIDEMHPENAYVVVRQRGSRSNGKDKHREVPHTKQSRQRVQTWLDFRELLIANPSRLKVGHDDPWLSLAANQPFQAWLKPMRWARFGELLSKQVGEGWELHRFRHTCATNYLRAGMPLEKVQRLLGHANIQQTLCYTKIVRDDIQRSVEQHEDAFEDQVNGDDG